MKFIGISLIALLLFSCGRKVAFTNQVKEEFALEIEKNIKKVQFYTSQTIILKRSKESGNQGTSDDGALVTNKSKEEDRVIIQANTPCVFERYGAGDAVVIRFETGVGKTISFVTRHDAKTGKYYLHANWVQGKGGEVMYGNEKYTVPSTAGNTYLRVVIKNLQKTKRKDRVVKGMKV